MWIEFELSSLLDDFSIQKIRMLNMVLTEFHTLIFCIYLVRAHIFCLNSFLEISKEGEGLFAVAPLKIN